MTAQSQSPLGALLALAFIPAFWLPSLGGTVAAPAPAQATVVVATAWPLVLM